MNIEQHRMKGAINHFCREARNFGLVIDPKSVALELCADKKIVSLAARILEAHADVTKADEAVI